MNFGDFGYIATFWIFTHTKIVLISNIESSSMINCFISKVSLCKTGQKQQKEVFFYFNWKPDLLRDDQYDCYMNNLLSAYCMLNLL